MASGVQRRSPINGVCGFDSRWCHDLTHPG